VQVPKTFNELIQVCQTLKSKGITPFAEGFKDGWAAQVDYQSDLYSTLWKTPNIFRDITAGTKNYADFPEVKAAFERFAKRMQYAQPNPLDTTNEQAIDLFATGKTAMIAHGAFALASIRKISPNGNFGFLPNFSSNTPGESRIMVGSDTIFMIASESEHKDVALALFTKIATPEVAKLWAQKLNNLSAVIGATPEATDPALKDMKAFIDSGKAFNIYSIDILTGQLDDVWRKTQEQFAADPNRDPAAYIKKLDDSLANIRKSS
jgi:raffinose/stachyose/melibiose transport system substrate-binding protein